MKSVILPAFDAARPASEQLADNFTACGINADWSVQAYHLSDKRFTGHAPNTISGDFYLIEDEDRPDAWQVVIRTYSADRTDAQQDGNDLIEVVAGFGNSAEAWMWLQDPVSQQFYLLGTADEINEARGLTFRGDDVVQIKKGDIVRILPAWQDSGDEKFIWVATDDESKGRVSISPVNIGLTIKPIQTVERRMVQPVAVTIDSLKALEEADVAMAVAGLCDLSSQARNSVGVAWKLVNAAKAKIKGRPDHFAEANDPAVLAKLRAMEVAEDMAVVIARVQTHLEIRKIYFPEVDEMQALLDHINRKP